MPQFVNAAGFLLFAREQPPKFLLMRHKNRWDLPKGHAEPGEDILTTALRETQEESGVPAKDIEVDPDFQFIIEYCVNGVRRGTYEKRVTYFIGYLPKTRDIELTEHSDYRWWNWPTEAIQSQTIDPLLNAAKIHFESFPERLQQGG